jgi:hypothetical protein
MPVLGSNPNQVSTNQDLGRMAFQDPSGVVLELQTSVTPYGIGNMVFQLTSDTQLTIKVKGSDGVVRSANITLA